MSIMSSQFRVKGFFWNSKTTRPPTTVGNLNFVRKKITLMKRKITLYIPRNFPVNWDEFSGECGEWVYQDIAVIGKLYMDKCRQSILAGYCRMIIKKAPKLMISKY